jgi:MSHA biogenesis protein MshM
MYLDYFGLHKPPFRITPDTHVFFEGCERGATLHGLCYAIMKGEGIIKVVGEVGSGKTMLCRMLPVKLADSVEWVYLAHPRLSPEQTLHEIARELGLEMAPDADKLAVMRALHEVLLKRHAQNRRVVVLVEEAQEVPLDTLEEIRLLSNLETDEHKLLQIVLFGQPELDTNLQVQHIRQLRERITHSLYLSPLQMDDVRDYLNFRMRSCGYKGPDVFSRRVAKEISRFSHGLARRINILADKALLAAFTSNRYTLTVADVRAAAHDSGYQASKLSWRGWRNWRLALLAGALAAVFVFGNSQLSPIARLPAELLSLVEIVQ